MVGKVQSVLIIAALLAANTASAFAGQTARAAVPRTVPPTRPLLVCFGDSLTAGFGADQSYPDFLQKDLEQAHYNYKVVNEGVSGATTKDGVARLDQVLRLHPSIVVVEFGGNDGLRGVPISQSRANLEKIVSTLEKAGIQVAIAGITLPPQYGEDYVHQFDQTYVMLANRYHTPMLPFLLQDAYGKPGMIQPDGIHATAKGNEVVARNVFNLLKPLLKK